MHIHVKVTYLHTCTLSLNGSLVPRPSITVIEGLGTRLVEWRAFRNNSGSSPQGILDRDYACLGNESIARSRAVVRVKETVPRQTLYSPDPAVASRKIGQVAEIVARCLYCVSAAKREKRRSSACSVGGVSTG